MCVVLQRSQWWPRVTLSMCRVTEVAVVAKSNIEYVSCYRGRSGGQE